MEAVTHVLSGLRLFSLGARFSETSHKLCLLAIINERVQDLKFYGDLCVSVQCAATKKWSHVKHSILVCVQLVWQTGTKINI